jgi:inorganic pyrophosphatase
MFQAHPWHGVDLGPDAPDILTVYIEIVPTDTVKYELDKITGHLKVDRPQRYSSICPTLYGLIPRTYCGELVGEYCRERSGRAGIVGDGDPMDICVLAEKTVQHGEILLRAAPIGGFRLLDGNEADDKIIAVMTNDAVHEHWRDITDCPRSLIERLKHYFLTYKDLPDATTPRCELLGIYGADEAKEVIRRGIADYDAKFGSLETALAQAIGLRPDERPSSPWRR